jgi:hypothetical protein
MCVDCRRPKWKYIDMNILECGKVEYTIETYYWRSVIFSDLLAKSRGVLVRGGHGNFGNEHVYRTIRSWKFGQKSIKLRNKRGRKCKLRKKCLATTEHARN